MRVRHILGISGGKDSLPKTLYNKIDYKALEKEELESSNGAN